MTARKPLVHINGRIQELPTTDVVDGGSSRFGSTWCFDQSPGRYFDNAATGNLGNTAGGAAGRIDLAPMQVARSVTVDQIGASVSTAVAASLFRCLVYDADQVTGRPTNLLLSSGDLSGATVAYAFAAVSFTFQAGRRYWVGTHHSSTCSLRTIALGGCYQLGIPSSSGAGNATVVRQVVTFGASSPATWTWVDANLTASITPPSVRFRVASVTS